MTYSQEGKISWLSQLKLGKKRGRRCGKSLKFCHKTLKNRLKSATKRKENHKPGELKNASLGLRTDTFCVLLATTRHKKCFSWCRVPFFAILNCLVFRKKDRCYSLLSTYTVDWNDAHKRLSMASITGSRTFGKFSWPQNFVYLDVSCF